jgi:hypothetical protein
MKRPPLSSTERQLCRVTRARSTTSAGVSCEGEALSVMRRKRWCGSGGLLIKSWRGVSSRWGGATTTAKVGFATRLSHTTTADAVCLFVCCFEHFCFLMIQSLWIFVASAALKWHVRVSVRVFVHSHGHLQYTGVTEDHSVAFKWFLRAAEQDDPVGQFKVGRCYDEGRGVDADPFAAFRWCVDMRF